MNNLVFITGRLTADSEITYFQSGKCKTTFTIAVDNYMNKEKFTSFIKCEIWGKQAEFAVEYFKKGKSVSVFGELTSREHEGKTYYTVTCKTANFANSLMVVKGVVIFNGENKIKIQADKNILEAEYYLKNIDIETSVHTFVLNLGFKDYKPVYSVVAVM